MFDIGFAELVVIGALALIVVGPKELPGLLRTVGKYVGKARSMARDFQRTMEDAAREADLGDAADLMKSGSKLNKLPFDNQVTKSVKEFGRSIQNEVNEAARVGAAAAPAPKPAAAAGAAAGAAGVASAPAPAAAPTPSASAADAPSKSD